MYQTFGGERELIDARSTSAQVSGLTLPRLRAYGMDSRKGSLAGTVRTGIAYARPVRRARDL